MANENPFMELPDENPFMSLPDEKKKLKSEQVVDSFMERANRFSQGMSSKILSGMTLGISNLLPGVPEETKQNIKQFDEEHPVLGTVAEIGAGVAQGYGLVKGAQAVAPKAMSYISSKVPSWLQLSGLAAGEGGIYGAATAEPGERIKGGAVGTGIGAVAGPAGGAAVKGAATVGKGLYSLLGRMLANTPDQQAVRIIRKAIEAEDLSPEFIEAELRRLGPEARLVDVSEGLTRTARGAAAMDKRAHGIADGFLKKRQSGQTGRLVSTVGGSEFDPSAFSKAFTRWMRGRIKNADELYDEAFSTPVQSTPKLEALMKRPSVVAAMKKASGIVTEEGGGFGHMRFFDAVKQELDDKIGAALRAGNKNAARRLINTKKALVEELDNQVPSYKEARNVFAGEAQLKGASEMGYETVTKNKDLWVIEEAIEAMSESEQHAFRLGALRGIIDKLDRSPANRNAAQKLIESNRSRQMLRMVFPDEESFNRFIQTAEAESTFSGTKNTVLGGSPTTRITEDVKDIQEGLSAGSAILQGGDPLSIAARFFKSLGIGKPNPDSLKVVAETLFSRKLPQKQMKRILSRPSIPNVVARSGAVVGGTTPATSPMINNMLGEQ